jgi:hypothetical protein
MAYGGSDIIADDSFLQSTYDFRYRVFPEDLTNDDVGHYMVININTPTDRSGGNEPRSAYTGARYRTSVLNNELSKVDILRWAKSSTYARYPQEKQAPYIVGPFDNTIGGVRGEGGIRRATRRVAESIALFMPTPIIYSSVNVYPDTTIAGMLGGMITGATDAAGKKAGQSWLSGAIDWVTGVATNVADGGAAALGSPINPRIAVMYQSSPLRQFNFEFLMAPKTEQESKNMDEIITTLRSHAAPELEDTAGTGISLTFIPPAEFDITFFNKGAENMHLPRINTCVLTRIDVDYAPSGAYATFSNGYPVACRMTLGFSEIEILHKRRVLQGF